ncbi:hypothetical protein YC2023_053143 [Brassica napus]
MCTESAIVGMSNLLYNPLKSWLPTKKKKLHWSDDMTRFLLELITLEKQDGNSKGKNLTEQGKQNLR